MRPGGSRARTLVPVAATVLALVAPAVTGPPAAATTTGASGAGRDEVPARVVAISVDGLGSGLLRRLGPERTPTLHRLLAEGASTREARTARELTLTLPNHTTMLTGRRVDRRRGGHGVTWNRHRPRTTVHRAAGHRVSSVFATVHRAGGGTALFAGKDKFTLFERTWPRAIDELTWTSDDRALLRAARRDLRTHDRDLTFLHLAAPDVAGHAHGFRSASYLDAVERVDRQVAGVLRTLQRQPHLSAGTTVVLTADHGGAGGHHHGERTRPGNYRIPFLAWGAGVEAGDLYALNPQRRHPGAGRPSYAGRQPVRNGDLANLVTGLLGLDPVRASRIGAAQDLRVRAD